MAPQHPLTEQVAEPPERLLGRRTAIRAGAVGGALLWTVPTLTAVGISAAHAEDPSGPGSPPPPPPPPPGPPPPPPTGTLPSHGFVLVDCGDGVFGVKIEGNPATLGALGAGNDVKFLKEQKGLVLGVDYRQATAEDLAHLAGYGITGFDPDAAGPAGNTIAYYIALGPDCTLFDGYSYVFDGSFAGGGENCGDADKFTKAFVSGRTVYFTAMCNEPVTGEN